MLSRLRLPSVQPSRPPIGGLLVAAAGLTISTCLAAILVHGFGLPDAAIVYLLSVVAVGTAYGSWLAVGTSVASFLLYDFLFVQPLYTFAIAAPEEWLDLLLFLFVAIAIGRLSALQLERRREAELRTAEARAMFAMSRDVANAATALEAAPMLVARLAREAQMARVWIGLNSSGGEERVTADTAYAEPRPALAWRWVLHAVSAEAQPSWARVRDPIPARGRDGSADGSADHSADHSDHHDQAAREGSPAVFRVPIRAGGEQIGSVWATRPHSDPFPGRSHSRLLAAAADQLGQAVVRDRLAAEATAAEVARQGDALKSALLDSVSHDLRTPLAGIRAAAGNLMDPEVTLSREEERAAARSIDREAERLSRLVRNMLDLSRIEGGALHPSLELYDLADLVTPVVERLRPALAPSEVELAIADDLPPVRADGIFVDQILTNLLENAVRYATGKRIVVSAAVAAPSIAGVAERVELAVEDAGPGVPVPALMHLFDRFYRGPRRTGSRSEGGSGIGLAVVRGLTDAMGGSVEARQSSLGGLAVIVRLQIERAGEPERPAPAAAEAPGTGR